MDGYPIAVVGEGNIGGNHLVNVGNRVFNFYASQRETGTFYLYLHNFSVLMSCREGFGRAEAPGRIRRAFECEGTLSSPEMPS